MAPILTPFVAASIFAYVCQPLVTKLSGNKISRTTASLTVMLVALGTFIVILLILFPLLSSEITLFVSRLPDLLDTIQTRLLPLIEKQLGVELRWDAAVLKSIIVDHYQTAGSVAGKVIPWLTGGGAVLINLVLNLLLIPLVMFYLLRDWPQLLMKMDALLPRLWYSKTRQIVMEIDAMLGQFMRGQLLVILLMCVYYVFGLWLVGVEFALPIGLVSGLLVFIPYVGMMVGVGLATLVALGQFEVWSAVIWVWLVFGIGQAIEGVIVTPRLVGERIGLHPLAVIFSLLAFAQLFGFVGVLLALPIAAAILVCLEHIKVEYLKSRFYRE
jgi:predicted PurR-regulated permease PerM